MGKPGKKASNIFQNMGIKNNNGVTLPTIKGIGSPLKNGDKFKKMATSFGKSVVGTIVHSNPVAMTMKAFGKGDAVQSFENKVSRKVGLPVSYSESYADADKKKYPTQESFTKAAKEYNKNS